MHIPTCFSSFISYSEILKSQTIKLKKLKIILIWYLIEIKTWHFFSSVKCWHETPGYRIKFGIPASSRHSKVSYKYYNTRFIRQLRKGAKWGWFSTTFIASTLYSYMIQNTNIINTFSLRWNSFCWNQRIMEQKRGFLGDFANS